MEAERWAKISGHPRYSVSSFGFIRNDKTGRILKSQPDGKGYLKVKIPTPEKKVMNYTVHRLVANAFVPRVVGKELLDHVDRCRTNNRASNLRWCDKYENNRNRSIMSNNTTGVTGVYKHTTTGKWMAFIRAGGKMMYLGLYDTKEEAQFVRDMEAGFLFGEFHRDHTDIPEFTTDEVTN